MCFVIISLDLLEYVAFSGLPMSKWTVNEVKVEASGLTVESQPWQCIEVW